MKKSDTEKEIKFVELFAVTGNATESARKSGFENNPSQMGYYLKGKLRKEIEEYRANYLFDLSGGAIVKLKELMNSESDTVCLNACKHILDLSGYSAEQTINLRTSDDNEREKIQKMNDEELEDKLAELIQKIPHLKKKLLQH
jgi:hypothetical protein|tara:strand:- start:239 stop:667 length:429 start_codon:yes stop_codon:yes gene_type:complete